MTDSISTSPTRRWSAVRLLVVALSIPLAAATFTSPVPQPLEPGFPRSTLLHVVSDMIEQAPGWYVIARFEDPVRGNWTIVTWYDCPVRPNQVDPNEILVLEKPANADVLLATTRNPAAGPCDPLQLEVLITTRFLREIRKGFAYMSHVIGKAEVDEGVEVITALMEDRVRELEEPMVSLTSVID